MIEMGGREQSAPPGGGASELPTASSGAPGSQPQDGARPPIVEAVDVVKRFKRRRGGLLSRLSAARSDHLVAVNKVSFTIEEDEAVGLVGESGSGKTTLGKAILRLHDLDEGRILLEGRDIHQMDRATLKKVRPRYQMIFQNPLSSLNPGMRVWDMLAETVSLHLGLKGLEAAERIADILYVVQLTDKGDAYPSQLSGGERRRVGLARVLLLNPRLIVADEPTSGLDASLKAGIVNLMLETRARGTAYLFISHDLHLIRYVADRIMVMLKGRIVEIVPQHAFRLGEPHHPYTELLLHSMQIHRNDGSLVQLLPVDGTESVVPAEDGGCFYRYQCPRARRLGTRAERCAVESPRLVTREAGWAIACHFPDA